MPTYSYECRDCGNRFFETMHITDVGMRSVRCPRCSGQHTEQLIQAAYVATMKKS
jgi:putative FmdB family regulatory protein